MRRYFVELVFALASVGVAFAAHGDPASTATPAPPSPAALLRDPNALARWLHRADAEVLASAARVEAANATAAQTHVLPNPTLEVDVGGFVLGQTNPAGLGLRQTTAVTTGLTELIELGKRGARQRAAGLRANEAVEASVGVLGGRVNDAMGALGKVAYLSARRASLAANLADAKHMLALEKIRLDHADLSGADYGRIELDTQRVELDMDRTEADLISATTACEAAIYAPCPAAAFDDKILDDAAQVPAALSPDAVDSAITSRPALAAQRIEAGALSSDADVAIARRIPDPTVGVSYTHDNNTVAGDQGDSLALSLSIPLPLFDRGNNDAGAARANAKVIAAEEQVTRRHDRGEVAALTTLRTALERAIKTLRDDAVPKSADLLKKSRASFDLGNSDLSDLLIAEKAHRDLLLQLLDTEFELFQTRSNLRQDLGLDDAAARTATQGSQQGTPP